MSVVLWVVGVLLAFLAAVVASPKFRKAAFIWGTYVTLTGWYYYRVLEKKYKAPAADSDAKSPRVGKAKSTSSLASSASGKASTSGAKRDEDVVYFESPEEIQRRLETTSRASEASSSRLSDASSSDLSAAASDDTLGRLPKPPKTHLGIFRRGVDDKRRAASDPDAVASSAPARLSDATTASASSSRRTFTGRYKKPANWGD